MMEVARGFGENLRHLRKEAGISQETLGFRCSLHRTEIGLLERGARVPRGLKPIVQEVDAPWAGFHTFRHTFASIHLSQGTNLLQLSRALGHHSAAFTLSRYTHLLPGDEAPALDLSLAAPGLCVQAEEARIMQPAKAQLNT